MVHRLPLPGGAPVWSAAWSPSCDQQLLLGLDQGRLALFDLRMTGRPHRGLLALTAGDALLGRQPLLRLAAAPAGLLGEGGARNACVVATPGEAVDAGC